MIIHVAKIIGNSYEPTLLLLKKEGEDYRWFIFKGDKETPTEVTGATPEKALRNAAQFWENESFTPLNCGIRFTLPERDEIGTNALFCQMGPSLDSMNGVYFDPELGHNCIVNNPSKEARELWGKLKTPPAPKPPPKTSTP